ncbi:hypothetical protein D3C75_1138240 [compost metagenome]
MAVRAAIALTTGLLEDLDLLALAGFDQGCSNRRTVDQRSADRNTLVAAQHEDFTEIDGSASVAVEFLDNNHIARLNPVLLSAGLDHRVHLEASA